MSLSDPFNQGGYDIAEPYASAMVESLRAFGYNLQTAIADLIDNSITAKAQNVWVNFYWDGPDSYISILDDGDGMTEAELVMAMRPGSQSPLEKRNTNDLGRFGLGLKTASFSQCRQLTVASHVVGSLTAIRRWDLDYIQQVNEWRLLREPAHESTQRLQVLETMPSGTLIVWEHLDRVVASATTNDQKAHNDFLEAIEVVEHHLAMTFHRFLEKRNPLKIWINQQPITPWNPFLLDAQATQFLPLEILKFQGEEIRVQPYVLPHHSKIDARTYDWAAGMNGWNDQQGFYVYRNERLLVSGDWLGLGYRKEEYCKLARIQIDLPNSIDSSWKIDVKKSKARPPALLKADLRRIAKLLRHRATEVYRHRGKILVREKADSHIFPWNRKIRRGKIFYSVNQEHPLIQEALNLPDDYKPVIRSLLRLLEETVPIEQIWIESSTDPDKQIQPFEGTPSEEVVEVAQQIYQALRKQGFTEEESRQRVSLMEPFQNFSQVVQSLSDSQCEESA